MTQISPFRTKTTSERTPAAPSPENISWSHTEFQKTKSGKKKILLKNNSNTSAYHWSSARLDGGFGFAFTCLFFPMTLAAASDIGLCSEIALSLGFQLTAAPLTFAVRLLVRRACTLCSSACRLPPAGSAAAGVTAAPIQHEANPEKSFMCGKFNFLLCVKPNSDPRII